MVQILNAFVFVFSVKITRHGCKILSVVFTRCRNCRDSKILENRHTTGTAKKAVTAGFEPTQAKPSRFQVYPLNPSGK
jgi:hypothetical protein